MCTLQVQICALSHECIVKKTGWRRISSQKLVASGSWTEVIAPQTLVVVMPDEWVRQENGETEDERV